MIQKLIQLNLPYEIAVDICPGWAYWFLFMVSLLCFLASFPSSSQPAGLWFCSLNKLFLFPAHSHLFSSQSWPFSSWFLHHCLYLISASKVTFSERPLVTTLSKITGLPLLPPSIVTLHLITLLLFPHSRHLVIWNWVYSLDYLPFVFPQWPAHPAPSTHTLECQRCEQ